MATVKEHAMAALNVRIPEGVKKEIDTIAAEDRRTLAATVEIALEHWIRDRRAETAARPARAARAR